VPILTAAAVRQALATVIDPELQQNIVDLGLVYDVQVTATGAVNVLMTLTTPHCPRTDEIQQAVRTAVLAQPTVTQVTVELVWQPPWTPYRMAEALRAPLGLPVEELALPSTPAAAWRTRVQRLKGLWQRPI
jgi:metal-sulfur cluster biosynthetic enzyme